MEVNLNKRYPLQTPPAQAWAVLRDLRTVVNCMPGASLSEQTGPNQFLGSIQVKVGPTLARFNGDIEVASLHESAREICIHGKGYDKGGSSVVLHLTSSVEPLEGDTCTLVGIAQIKINGRFAQFGGRMIEHVSDIVMDEFITNFARAANQSSATSVANTVAPARPLNALTLLWCMVKDWVCRHLRGHGHPHAGHG